MLPKIGAVYYFENDCYCWGFYKVLGHHSSIEGTFKVIVLPNPGPDTAENWDCLALETNTWKNSIEVSDIGRELLS